MMTHLDGAAMRWLLAAAALVLALTLLPAGPSAATDSAVTAAPDSLTHPDPEGEDHCNPELTSQPSDTVDDPDLIGPIGDEGIRTQEPYGTTMVAMPEGWVEHEFFLDGTAITYPEDGSPGEQTAYRTRIMIRRPTDPDAFNGTVIVDWNNVTIPHDRDVAWAPIYPTLFERGYAYMSVGAQRLGIELSPLAVKQYDPVRYGSLNHPGDDWSYDIFSQAAEAALTDEVMGDLAQCVQRRIGMGASQSASRLTDYINLVQEHAGVFDGFTPQIIGSSGVRRDVVPIIWVNSTAEAADVPADSDLFRLWELSGAAHTSNQSSSYQDELLNYSHSNGTVGEWDSESAGAWQTEAAPGDCLTRNYYQSGFIWAAAVVRMDEWIRTGDAPSPQPRIARSADGADELFDEFGHALDGVRLPLVDVPIASYYAGVTDPPGTHPCTRVGALAALQGTTLVFDTATLAEMYPTREAYLEPFAAAAAAAVDAGTLLPEGAEILMARAELAADWIVEQTAAVPATPGMHAGI